ncbi:NRDE family protein [Pistricoccus aurantiacus]|uniref:NRDE family protein n=1 Tax=Pistricoccus aurantiacus TaxID=1883414 RepID=UPI00363B0B81
MCLIAFDYRPRAATPLRLIANRDEQHARPAAALDFWEDVPDILGGRDLQAGGSWLAVHRSGRLAAVTNVRDPRIEVAPDAPSRGELVRGALECADLETWLKELAASEARRYAGFNLLAGRLDANGLALWHLHRGYREIALGRITPGLHGLSNASLDTAWPKLLKACQGLETSLAGNAWPDAALETMRDDRIIEDAARLPDTGVGLALERQLSPPFILDDVYGTRATTWVSWHANGEIEIGERRFGPEGVFLGETRQCMQTR